MKPAKLQNKKLFSLMFKTVINVFNSKSVFMWEYQYTKIVLENHELLT